MYVEWKLVLVHFEVLLAAAQDTCNGLHLMYLGHGNHFGHTQWYFKVMRLKWKLDSVCSEIVLILAQDRCTVCAECTTGMEIILGTPDGTPR